MFDDLLDPMATARRLQDEQMRQNALRAQAGPVKIDPLSEQDEQGLLPKIGNAALGGLAYVGDVLSKPANAVRGILAGKGPKALANLIPFSDAMGLTTEADKTSGRELLRKYGMIGNDDTWGNFFAGLGTELATDPLMWTTFGTGALTEGGQVAQKLGMLPKTMRGRVGGTLGELLAGATPEVTQAAEMAVGGAGKLAPLMDQSLGGLFGVKVPFSELFGGHATPLLTGQAGLGVLDAANATGQALRAGVEAVPLIGSPIMKGIDATGRGIGASGRYLGSLFDARNMGATSEIGQEAGQKASREILPFAAKYKERALRLGEELNSVGLGQPGGLSNDEFRRIVEGLASSTNPEVNRIAQSFRGTYDEMLKEAQRLNLRVAEFEDPMMGMLGYNPRQLSKMVEGGGGFGSSSTAQALAASDRAIQTQRLPAFSGFSDGTAGINRMFQDVNAYSAGGMNAAGREAYIAENYLRPAEDILRERIARGLPGNQMGPINVPEELANIRTLQREQVKDLVKRIDSLPEQYAQAAGGNLLDKAGNKMVLTAFGENPVQELMNYADRFANMRAKGIASQDMIAKTLEMGTHGATPTGNIGIEQALQRAGLDTAGVPNHLIDRVNDLRAAKGLPPVTGLTGGFVPQEIAAELSRVNTPFANPEALNPIIGGLDWLTNLFKTNVTTYWPGFNVRNFLSGQFMNASKGEASVLGKVGDAYRMLKGEAIQGLEEIPAIKQALIDAGRPVTAEEATKQLARWQAAYGVGGHTPNIGKDVVSAAGDVIHMPQTLQETLSQVSGVNPKGFGTVLDTLRGVGREEGWWNPLNVAGVNAKQDKFLPVVAGRHAGDIIEHLNRTPMFMQALEEGFTPAEAARKVLGAHYDYTKQALTPFEKTVMRRLIPFYSFTRQNMPNIIGQLVENPGGLAGTMARLSDDLRQKGGFLPEYMGNNLAIPIGEQTPEGMQRYLNRLDLPPDQAFEWFKGLGKDPLQSSIMGFIGQLNPMLKGPLEYAVNKQFFTGRELGDLYSMTGNRLLDQALFNSPLARAATTTRQALDYRKDTPTLLLNLLTGSKFTDVDIPKYQAIAEREYIKDQLQGNPAIGQFQTLSVRPDQIGALNPEQMQLVQLQRLLEKRARDQAKARK